VSYKSLNAVYFNKKQSAERKACGPKLKLTFSLSKSFSS